MRFVYHPSIDGMGQDADDLIDKDNGNETVASDVEEQYQPLLLAVPDLLEACTIALDYFIINREGADTDRDRIRPILQAAVDKAKGV